MFGFLSILIFILLKTDKKSCNKLQNSFGFFLSFEIISFLAFFSVVSFLKAMTKLKFNVIDKTSKFLGKFTRDTYCLINLINPRTSSSHNRQISFEWICSLSEKKSFKLFLLKREIENKQKKNNKKIRKSNTIKNALLNENLFCCFCFTHGTSKNNQSKWDKKYSVTIIDYCIRFPPFLN